MLKKLNQIFITKYPLIWNLKLIWILLTAIGMNIIAFITGFLFFNKKSQLQETQLFENFYNSGIVMYFVLCCIIILAIWIYFYIKHNRFKSYFPTSRNYLFKEFLAVFFVLFIFFYIPNSFKSGMKIRVANYMTEQQYLKDIDIINRTQAFTLQPSFGYNSFSRNLTVPIFDSLVSEQETKQLFDQNQLEHLKDLPNNPKKYEQPYFRNEEFETLLKEYFPERRSYQPISFMSDYTPLIKTKQSTEEEYYPSDVVVEEATVATEIGTYQVDSVSTSDSSDPKIYYNLASLYNYSNLSFENKKDSKLNHQFYDEQLIALLEKNDRELIEKQLDDYMKLLKKHEIGFQFINKEWIDYLPQSPYYFIDYKLNNSEIVAQDQSKSKIEDYINVDSLNQLYRNIETAKYESTWLENIQFYMMFSLSFTILIITFRMSSFKAWLATLIGAGILLILGSVFGLALNAIFYKSNNYIHYIIVFFFYFVFLGLILYGLKSKKYKLLTGINLNWFVATNIFIMIVFLSFYTDLRTDMLYDSSGVLSYYDFKNQNQELRMLDKISEIFLYVNPLINMISFYFIIGWYKKWQAMPEE